jgi:hypothetical protein
LSIFASEFLGILVLRRKPRKIQFVSLKMYPKNAFLAHCHLFVVLQGYDPELFSKALPCLAAIGCALSPDYSISNQDDGYYDRCVAEAGWTYDPQPGDTSK